MALKNKTKNTLKIGVIAAVGTIVLTLGAIRLASTPDWLMRNDERKLVVLNELTIDELVENGTRTTGTAAGVNTEEYKYVFEDDSELYIVNMLSNASDTLESTKMIHDDSSQARLNYISDNQTVYYMEIDGKKSGKEITEVFHYTSSTVATTNSTYNFSASSVIAKFDSLETIKVIGLFNDVEK